MWQPVKPKRRKTKKKNKWLYGIMGIYVAIAACAMFVLLRQSGFWHKSEETAGMNVVVEGSGQDAQNSVQDIDGTVSGETDKSGASEADEPETLAPEEPAGSPVPKEEAPGVFPAETFGPAAETVYTVRGASSVRMWTEPEQQGSVIAALPEGTFGKVLKQGKYYSKIEYNGTSGYVYNGYLEITNSLTD